MPANQPVYGRNPFFTRLYIFSSHRFTSTSISFRLEAQLNLTVLIYATTRLDSGWLWLRFSVIFSHSRHTTRKWFSFSYSIGVSCVCLKLGVVLSSKVTNIQRRLLFESSIDDCFYIADSFTLQLFHGVVMRRKCCFSFTFSVRLAARQEPNKHMFWMILSQFKISSFLKDSFLVSIRS